MFKNHPDAQVIARDIANTVVFKYPSHGFFLDYHMCKKLGLVVDELTSTESDITKALVQSLDKFTMNGVICKEVETDYRMPFITLYENMSYDNVY